MSDNYKESLDYWNSAFVLDEKTKEEYKAQIDPEEDWKQLQTSDKFRNLIIDTFKNKQNVLDYGAGAGWGGVTIRKGGCCKVTCVDVVANAKSHAEFYAELFNIKDGYEVETVSTDWISTSPEKVYDGLFCSNVVDVIPTEVAEDIIKNMARITTDDAAVIIGMNYYSKPVSNPERNIEVKNGNELYVNGILRMVARTDDEWKAIIGKYFNIEKLDYYAWPGEEKETRRIFVLSKK